VSSVAPVRARFEGIAEDPVQDRKLQQAARQFEALFMQRIVSAMRKETNVMSSTSGGTGSHMYEHMINTSLADHMTQGRGVGIADSLYRDWTGKSLNAADDMTVTRTVDPPSVPAALLELRSMNSRPTASTIEAPETDPGLGIDDGVRPLREMLPPDGTESLEITLSRVDSNAASVALNTQKSKEIEESLTNINNGESELTIGIDDGKRPLREMLPPDGTEKDDFFLNDSEESHDGHIGRKLSARGFYNEYEKHPTNDNDGSASSVSRNSTPRQADGNRGGRQADLLGDVVASAVSGRYERHPVLGGDQ